MARRVVAGPADGRSCRRLLHGKDWLGRVQGKIFYQGAAGFLGQYINHCCLEPGAANPCRGEAFDKTAIRARLETVCAENGATFLAPPLALCTDNAAMIAYAGLERFAAGHQDDMTLVARPRWPLDKKSPALLGSGKKGAKA